MGMDSIGLFDFVERSFASNRSVGFAASGSFDRNDRASNSARSRDRDDR